MTGGRFPIAARFVPTVEDLNDYQPHQVARKYTAWARLQGLKAESRIVPETYGLRIEELAREMDASFIEAQKEGTRRRIREGKVSESSPACGRRQID